MENDRVRHQRQRSRGVAWSSFFVSALLAVEGMAAAPRETLPEFQVIPAATAAELTTSNGWPAVEDYRGWTRSNGGPTSNRYSALNQINRSNVGRLRVAWTYRSGDGLGNVQGNPIVVGSTMFAPTSGKHIVALHAATGEELWRFRPESGSALQDIPARRGLLHWPGDATTPARIIFAAGKWVYALDPATGRPIASFGENGRAEIATFGTVGGVVWRRTLILPGYLGDVFGYDIGSGKLLWRFHTIPQPGEFGADSWEVRDGGANCWGGISLDEPRGIAYFSTGSPKPNFVGGQRGPGDNLFSNCVVALDAATGKRLWHFQEVRHDIWNYDIPAPPNLVTVVRDGRRIDAVAQVTKLGHTLLLDRTSGKPLFPFRLRRAPESTIPGEWTSPYQPDPELPERFINHFMRFQAEDITDRTPEARDFITKLIAGARYGTWFAPMALHQPTVTYGDNGGANWPGASVDPTTGRLYVTSSELPWIMSILRDDDPPPLVPATPGEIAYRQHCAACHGPVRRGLGMVPGLLGLRHRFEPGAAIEIIRKGRGAMPPMPQVPEAEMQPLVDFLLARDRPATPRAENAPVYVHAGFQRLKDHEGYTGIKPPWGTLTCIDLNSGRIVWKVPLGEYPELTRAGLAKTGTENYGGSTTTAGGLVFAGGTRDAKIRAFDADSGTELWAGDLPHDGSTSPTTYEVDGRQYVVIAAMGVRMLAGPAGDAWVAFALDEPR